MIIQRFLYECMVQLHLSYLVFLVTNICSSDVWVDVGAVLRLAVVVGAAAASCSIQAEWIITLDGMCKVLHRVDNDRYAAAYVRSTM